MDKIVDIKLATSKAMATGESTPSSLFPTSTIRHAPDCIAAVHSHPEAGNRNAINLLAISSDLPTQNKAWDSIQKEWFAIGHKQDVDLSVLKKLISSLANLHNNRATQNAVFAQVFATLNLPAFQAQPDQVVPIISLMAESIGAIKDESQRQQAFELIENALTYLQKQPEFQMIILNSLTQNIWLLDEPGKQRAFTLLEKTFKQTSEQSKLHIPVLVKLTDLMQWQECRGRAYYLVRQGLTRLEGDKTSCAPIHIGLGIAASKSAR